MAPQLEQQTTEEAEPPEPPARVATSEHQRQEPEPPVAASAEAGMSDKHDETAPEQQREGAEDTQRENGHEAEQAEASTSKDEKQEHKDKGKGKEKASKVELVDDITTPEYALLIHVHSNTTASVTICDKKKRMRWRETATLTDVALDRFAGDPSLRTIRAVELAIERICLRAPDPYLLVKTAVIGGCFQPTGHIIDKEVFLNEMAEAHGNPDVTISTAMHRTNTFLAPTNVDEDSLRLDPVRAAHLAAQHKQARVLAEPALFETLFAGSLPQHMTAHDAFALGISDGSSTAIQSFLDAFGELDLKAFTGEIESRPQRTASIGSDSTSVRVAPYWTERYGINKHALVGPFCTEIEASVGAHSYEHDDALLLLGVGSDDMTVTFPHDLPQGVTLPPPGPTRRRYLPPQPPPPPSLQHPSGHGLSYRVMRMQDAVKWREEVKVKYAHDDWPEFTRYVHVTPQGGEAQLDNKRHMITDANGMHRYEHGMPCAEYGVRHVNPRLVIEGQTLQMRDQLICMRPEQAPLARLVLSSVPLANRASSLILANILDALVTCTEPPRSTDASRRHAEENITDMAMIGVANLALYALATASLTSRISFEDWLALVSAPPHVAQRPALLQRQLDITPAPERGPRLGGAVHRFNTRTHGAPCRYSNNEGNQGSNHQRSDNHNTNNHDSTSLSSNNHPMTASLSMLSAVPESTEATTAVPQNHDNHNQPGGALPRAPPQPTLATRVQPFHLLVEPDPIDHELYTALFAEHERLVNITRLLRR